MIDRIIEFSIRNRALVIAAGLVLALWGVVAVYQTPVDAIPDLSENQVIVFTDWPGKSPREIEDQVTYPLSLGLQGLAGMKVVRLSSDFNFSTISVIFHDSVDFATARQRVAERLVQLAGELPDGVAPQLAPDALATGQIFWYTVEGAGYDLGKLRTIQDWYVRPQLASVPGVAEVASVGGHAVEFQIEVDPIKLRTHDVTMPEVLRTVSRSNSTTAGHVVQHANAEYLVRAVGWLGQPSDGREFDPKQVIRDLENTPVVAVHSPLTPGAPGLGSTHHSLFLSDVATVSLGGKPRRGVLEKDGSEVTGGVVLLRAGENPLEVTRRIKDKITQLASGLPKGVRIVPGYDRTPLITGAVRTVTGTLVEAIATASICVLVVLLHLRTSFIIAVTLPLATLASFVVMWTLRRLGVADIQTNIMSLAGIAISIGVLVDSSIVMAENVMHTLREHYGDRPVRGDVRRLVLPACRTVGRPIFFSVLIMLVSFAPVFALGGMEGKMFRPLAFTKSFALAAVAVLAITLVPALCTIFIRGRLKRETDSWLVRNVVEVYRPVLNYLLDRPAALAWIMSVTFIVGLAPVGIPLLFLATVFLGIVACGFTTLLAPSPRFGGEGRGEGRSLGAYFKTPHPNPLPRSGQRETARHSRWHCAALSIASVVLIALVADQNMKPLGREFITPLDEQRQSQPFAANELATNESAKAAPAANHHGARATLPPADPHPAFDSLVQDLSRQFASRLLLWPHERTTLYGFGSEMDRVLQMPGWTNVWTMPIQNRVDMLATGVNTEVGVRVLGGDLNELVRVSDEIAAVLKRVPGAAGVSADQIRGKGYLEVHPDRDKLSQLGLQATDVTEAVEAALAGNVATTVVAGRERVPVRVRYARDWRTDEDAVSNVLVPQLPLSAVADVRVTEGPATIKSENGMLRNYVRTNVRGRGVVDFVEEARRVVASQVKLPEGVFVEWTGQFEHQVRARNTLAIVLPIVLVVIFLLLYRTYRDWADAVLMMLAVPGAIAGGVFFQWLFGYKFSVTVWIGYIACFGMAMATGVIMLVYLREAVAKAGGIEHISLGQLRDAVLAGAVQRLRPKLLTEGTTILGLAPMLWATGPGAEVIRPMAAPVLGGILVADEVIDLFLPVLFYWVRRWRWQRLHAGEVCADNLHANESDESRRAGTNHENSVSSGEAADRLAETGLIHSSFSTVEQEWDNSDEAITQESATAT